ncbi:hypothetical protein J2S97_003706 [Arthrobacter oryzae]|nr:hypothetical protein [Arthrobacter oryzae]
MVVRIGKQFASESHRHGERSVRARRNRLLAYVILASLATVTAIVVWMAVTR